MGTADTLSSNRQVIGQEICNPDSSEGIGFARPPPVDEDHRRCAGAEYLEQASIVSAYDVE